MKILGTSVIKGMWVTIGHFCQTYIEDFKLLLGLKKRPDRLQQGPQESGVFTVMYPEQKLKTPERLRVLPVLIYEEKDGDVRCTSCGICAKVCPPQCIWIVQAKSSSGKSVPKPEDFFIDMDVCMNCGLCSEFCPFDAIKMDHHFELSNTERNKSHVYNMQDLLVSTEYYAKTHPRAWAQEEQIRAQKKAKKGPAAAAPAGQAPA